MMKKPTNLAIAHSLRFRAVSTRYPSRVSEAYRGHGGIQRAAKESDEQVATRVAAWERAQGNPQRNWLAIGHEEREGEPYDAD
jgi:hypothetical protein